MNKYKKDNILYKILSYKNMQKEITRRPSSY